MIIGDLEGNALFPSITKIWCGVFQDTETGEVRQFKPYQIKEMLSYMDSCPELCFHNGIGFDFPALEKCYNWTYKGKIIDTFVLSSLANPDRPGGHSVANWGKILGGENKVEHEDWSKYSPEMLERCTSDVRIQVQIYKALEKELLPIAQTGIDWKESIETEHKIAKIIFEQENTGAPFDTEKAREYLALLNGLLLEIEQKVNSILGTTVVKQKPTNLIFKKDGTYRHYVKDYWPEEFLENRAVSGAYSRVAFKQITPTMYDAVKKRYQQLGWIPTQFTDKGAPKLPDVDELEEFANRSGNENLKTIAKYGSIANRRNIIRNWIAIAVDNNNRLPAGAFTNGTNTARFRHTTVVNVPRAFSDKDEDSPTYGELQWYPQHQDSFFGTEMRSLFTSGEDEDYVLVGADAAGLELRCLAHYMNDPEFTKTLLEDDIHEYMWDKAGGVLYVKSRQDMKTTVYALLYGAGDYKLGTTCTAKTGSAYAAYGKAVKSALFAGLPKLGDLVSLVISASSRGYLRGLDGRKIWMRRGSRGVATNKALNTLLQSTGGILVKKWTVLVYEEIKKRGLDAKEIIHMHDEFTYLVHKDYAEEVAEIMAEKMVEAGEYFNLNLPLAADPQIGHTWAEIH